MRLPVLSVGAPIQSTQVARPDPGARPEHGCQAKAIVLGTALPVTGIPVPYIPPKPGGC